MEDTDRLTLHITLHGEKRKLCSQPTWTGNWTSNHWLHHSVSRMSWDSHQAFKFISGTKQVFIKCHLLTWFLLLLLFMVLLLSYPINNLVSCKYIPAFFLILDFSPIPLYMYLVFPLLLLPRDISQLSAYCLDFSILSLWKIISLASLSEFLYHHLRQRNTGTRNVLSDMYGVIHPSLPRTWPE